jgi:4-hydroxyphenylpyruvate dioxygenase
MKRTVTPNKITYFFFQLRGAMVADQNQVGYPQGELNQLPYMTQSRNCRIFPCEANRGGVLPVLEIAQAVFDLGYTGWVSMEVFHTDMWDPRCS